MSPPNHVAEPPVAWVDLGRLHDMHASTGRRVSLVGVSLVGVSLGGVFARDLARRHEDLVRQGPRRDPQRLRDAL